MRAHVLISYTYIEKGVNHTKLGVSLYTKVNYSVADVYICIYMHIRCYELYFQ